MSKHVHSVKRADSVFLAFPKLKVNKAQFICLFWCSGERCFKFKSVSAFFSRNIIRTETDIILTLDVFIDVLKRRKYLFI